MAEIDRPELMARITEMLNRHGAVGMAVGVVRDGSLDFFHGHGLADLASETPVTEDTVFRVASITKTFTAVAVMQLWERGLIDLDAPAADYLRAYRLVPAKSGLRPATVRHLLTHTSGIPEVTSPFGPLRPDFGESVAEGRPVPPLAEYYGGVLRYHAQPGTQWTYTDHGFATLGQIVEDLTGTPLERYLRERVFEPLGMADTALVPCARLRSRLATGYRLHADGPRAVAHREQVTVGASAAYSTPRDMARYAAALLGGGANEHGSVLDPATVDMMFAPHYQPDPRVPGMGLAFFRGSARGHRVIEHQGILPGFNSELFMAPDDGVAVMAFTNGADRALLWLPARTAGLLGYLIGVADETVRTDVAQSPQTWADLCGFYRLPGRITDVRARLMVGGGVKVLVRGGRLVLRVLTPIPALYRGLELHPDDEEDPNVFRLDLSMFGVGTARVVFGQDPETGAMAMCLDLIPISLRKRSPSPSRRRRPVRAQAAARQDA